MSSEHPEQPARPAWRPVTPEPIEVDTDSDIIRPVTAPPAEELFPTSQRGSLGGIAQPPVSPYSFGGQDTSPSLTPSLRDSIGPPADTDPVRMLGQSALQNASFSASGARTPMGGVPLAARASAPSPVTPFEGVPQFGDDEPRFQPRYEPASGMTASAEPRVSFSTSTAEIPTVTAQHQAEQHSSAPYPSTEQPVTYQPTTPAGFAPTSAQIATDGPPPGDDATDTDTPWWRSAVALVVYGLIVMAGIGYAVTTFLLSPEPIVLREQVLLDAPASEGVTPIDLEEPTAFLSGMPLQTLTYGLIRVDTFELRDVDLDVRTAEVHELTYSDAVDTYLVRAHQHFNEADAIEAFDSWAADAGSTTALTIDGAPTGEWAILETDDGTQIVWRNSTAVFRLTGPEEGIIEFFELFGV